MERPDELCERSLPVDVLQHLLSHARDARTTASCRLVSRAWLAASRGAAATVECSLPGNEVAAARGKLAHLRGASPFLDELRLNVGPEAAHDFLTHVLAEVAEFARLSSLDLRFSDVLEPTAADVAALASLGPRLARLRLENVSLPADLDLAPLAAGLPALRALALVQDSRVAPLLSGDATLEAVAQMTSLEDLELSGRLAGAGDDGLLALRRLAGLRRLAVGWVPWQSQVSQGAALQLLSGLPLLRSLKLGGAELLLPAVLSSGIGGAHPFPGLAAHHPAAAVAAAAAALGAPPAGPASAGLPAHAGGEGQQADPAAGGGAARPAPLRSMASAPVLGTSPAPAAPAARGAPLLGRGLGALRAAAGRAGSGGGAACASPAPALAPAPPGAAVNGAVCGALAHVGDVSLRFNCCGTSVQQTLLALGPELRARAAGLTWSYAKLGGSMYMKLLAGCTSLRSLEISMWYQDAQSGPTSLDLSALSGLVRLESLVVDKRPPFQQALPTQQATTAVPVTAPCLRTLAVAWPRLSSLHLGLARADVAPGALEELPRFSHLTSLTLHVYDTAWAPAPCALPVSVDHLPQGLVKLDLLHAELRAPDGPAAGAAAAACPRASGAGAAQRRSSGCEAGCGDGGAAAAAKAPAIGRGQSLGGSPIEEEAAAEAAAAACTPLAAAAAAAGARGSGLSSFPSGGPQAGRKFNPYLQIWAANHSGALVEAYSGVLAAAGSAALPPPAAAAKAGTPRGGASEGVRRGGGDDGDDDDEGGSSDTAGGRDQGISLLPAGSSCGSSGCGGGGAPAASPKRAGPTPVKRAISASPFAAAAAAASHAAAADAASHEPHSPAAPRPAAEQPPAPAPAAEPEAEAELAAATPAPCVAPQAAAPPPPQSIAGQLSGFFTSLLPQVSCPSLSLPRQFSLSRRHRTTAGRASSGGAHALAALRSGSDGGGAPAAAAGAAAAPGFGRHGRLPMLRELSLRHCSFDGIGLDDLLSNPGELRVLQLHELSGLRPRDVALLPLLASLRRLAVVAPKDDAWLGLAPLRLLSELRCLRQLDWVPSERALHGRLRAGDAQALLAFGHLHVLTLPACLAGCERLGALGARLPGGCQLRLMAPAYCEHARAGKASRMQRLISAASGLLDRAAGAIAPRGNDHGD